MRPTREQFEVLKRMARRMDSRINHQFRVVGDRDSYTTRQSVVASMVEAGYLTRIIHRAEDGSAVNEWGLTALGLGTFTHLREQRRAARFAARHAPIGTCVPVGRLEVLAILCSAPDVVILPNGSFRGAQPVEGIQRDMVPTKLKLAMFEDGLLERVAGAYRLPIFRATVKGIEALAEFKLAGHRHDKPECICGEPKSAHPQCGHVFADKRDVAVLDFIKAKLKEREHVA